MDKLIDRCAGLDVHGATVVATVRLPGADGGRQAITEAFATTTDTRCSRCGLAGALGHDARHPGESRRLL